MKKIFLFSLLTMLGMTQMLALEYEYVPFVREGVKWVYIVSTYDVISEKKSTQRFNLEFSGDTVINGKVYKAMHKYSGNSICFENDTIPVYMREENKIVYAIIPDGETFSDCPIGLYYRYSISNDGAEFEFCDFNDPASFWNNEIYESTGDDDLYQLVGIDTIQVGNHFAKCYKSVVGAAETNFYIIEGIGYDSMFGYTLFPFVPYFYSDPVFYGLSHVIENGEIIYRGIYYSPDTLVAIDEVVADQRREMDGSYYDLMGRSVGTSLPTASGIYIHHGKKIVVR